VFVSAKAMTNDTNENDENDNNKDGKSNHKMAYVIFKYFEQDKRK
jgi:hypothetical protein